MKILFFIPAHESIPVLKNCIENIQRYVKDPVILIHANASWHEFSTFEFSQYKNVIVLPRRFQFQKYTSMIPIIRYAYQYSLDIDYDYFSIFHTNCLFIKPGIEKYIDGCDISFYEYPGYNHPNAIRCMERSSLLKYVDRTQVYNNQAEGNVFRKDIFIKMMAFLETKLPELVNDPDTGEETIFATLSKMFSREDKRILPYLLMFYCKGRDITIEDVDTFRANDNDVTVFYDIPTKSSTVFCLKPINRTMNDPVRQYINNL